MSPVPCQLDGLRAAIDVIGGKWKCEILWHLREGTMRYAALRRALGTITDRVLIQQLRELVDEGLIERRDYGEVPPRVEYSLTSYAESIDDVLVAIGQWGNRHRRKHIKKK